MAHLLVSWIAHNNDFLPAGPSGVFSGVNPDGPATQFHRHLFGPGGYDAHVLLYSAPRQEIPAEHLLMRLRREHPGRAVRAELLALHDVIDLEEVKTKVETWLLGHAADELTLYFSPGTSIMQLSWYIAHTTLGLRTHLVQTRAGRFSSDGQPALLQLDITQSATPMTAVLREQQVAARLASPPPPRRCGRPGVPSRRRPTRSFCCCPAYGRCTAGPPRWPLPTR